MEFEIPADLTALSNEDLAALHRDGVAAFEAVYNGPRTAQSLTLLRDLRTALQLLTEEIERRDHETAELDAEAAALAAEVLGEDEADEAEASDDESEDDESDDEDDADDEDEDEDEDEAPKAVAASGRPLRLTIPDIARRAPRDDEGPREETTRATLMAAADVPGFATGKELDWDEVADAFIARARSFPKNAKPGSTPRISAGFANVHIPYPDHLVADSDNAMKVMDRAADESTLPGGSLVAAGGWCAPSETLYDLCALESTDGLFSLPSINVRRGGIRFTQGPDFRSIYNGTGYFHFTEQEDIDEEYTNVSGTEADKPCMVVPCPDFQEERLNVDGVCITSGILQDHAYPEITRRFIQGALVAHMHKHDARILAEVRNGSTSIDMPAGQVGTTAPILSSIELQVEDYRYAHRLSRSRTLEAVFPFWVRGAIRADLSRRLGVELLSVTDSQINGWFTSRGINPQFVVNWQESYSALDNDNGRTFGASPGPLTAWPTEVSFLLYTSGTWVKGEQDIIELTAVHDSTQFRRNNFTALFTEQAYLVAQRCHDSRLINVPICTDGATHAGVMIECDGSAT